MRRTGSSAHALLVCLAAFSSAGCASIEDAAKPPFVPEAGEMVARDAPEVSPRGPSGRALAESLLTADQVRLADLLRAVDAVSPEIAAAKDEVDAATGRAWQTGLHPNPSLEFRREGAADDRPWGRSQFLVGVRQPIVVSDRRRLAVNSELAERDVRRIEVEDVRRSVLGEARVAFVELVHARAAVALHRELIGLAEKTLGLARERVEAKVALDVEALKPELEVQSLRSELAGLERQHASAVSALEASLGGLRVPEDRLVRDEAPAAANDGLAALVARVREKHPAARAARRAVDAARERLTLARTESRPDIEIDAAVGRDFDGDDFVAELGVAIPLAVFDSGQGRIREAQSLVSKAAREAEAVENRLAALVSRRFGEFEAARARHAELRERLLPLAERSLEATREAFRNGKQEFLDLLDAQRTLLEARAASLALERDMDVADAEIQTLTGDAP